MGNFAAATNIARHIATQDGIETDVHAIEEFWPAFGAWGERMRAAAALPDANATAGAFGTIIAEIDALAIKRNETLREWVEPVSALANYLARVQPDHVIATKGLITRITAAARALSGQSFPLTNWITNSGLIALRCHRAPMADRHIVPLPEDRERLVRLWKVRACDIRVAGPLSRLTNSYGAPEMHAQTVDERRALLYFHVATQKAAAQIERCLQRDTAVQIIALHSHGESGIDACFADLERRFPGRFSARGELTQAQFHELFHWLLQAKSRVFISKSGPNTMFEAMTLGLPMILYRSGLPQEDWVLSYLRSHAIGVAIEDVAEMADAICLLLDDPRAQDEFLSRQASLMHALRGAVDFTVSDFSLAPSRRVA